MTKLLATAIPAAILALSAPAHAAITFCSGPANTCGGQGATVHLDGLDDGSDDLVNGKIKNDTVGVLITDFLTQNIDVDPNGAGQGQAWIIATGSTHQNPIGFDRLNFALQSGFHFTHIEFDLNPLHGHGPPTAYDVAITGFDGGGNPFLHTFTGITGNNFFNVNADGGDVLTHVRFVSTAPLEGVGHIRIAGVAADGLVPEPATWGLMILGFGGAGAMLRRRRAALA